MGFNPFAGSGNGGGGSGTDNYNSLSNKPQINGTVLSGNKTSDSLGLQNKISTTNKISSDFVDDENSTNKFMSEAEKTKLASLVNYDDTEVKEDISDIETSLNSHKSDTTNPHQVTKVQVGLGNVDNTSDANKPISTATQAALDEKVDKVNGKGLSTNDFTNEYKSQIETNTEGIGAVANAGAKNLLKISATSQTISGVTFTINSDGTITVNGTNTSSGGISFVIVPNEQAIMIPDGSYYLSGCPEGGDGLAFDLRWYRYSTGKSAYNIGGDTLVTKSGNTVDSNIAIAVKAGQTVDNAVFKPMLRDASIEDDTFVPYGMTNMELTQSVKPIPRLVDAGAKNLYQPTRPSVSNMGVQFTVNNDGTVSVSGTASPAAAVFKTGDWTCPKSGTYVVSGCPEGGAWAPNPNKYRIRVAVNNTWRGDDTGKGFSLNLTEGDVVEIQVNTAIDYAVSNLVFKPMICTKTDWDTSQEFVPYAPTNRELYEMILALQSGT